MTEGPTIDNAETASGTEASQLGASFDVDPTKLAEGIGGVRGVQFKPSVIIGIGGTGVQCLRRAKQKLWNRVGSVPTLAFVYVDADAGSFTNQAGLPPVEKFERCFIGGDRIWSVVDYPNDHKWLLGQIPEGLERAHYEPVAKGDGAGQIRAAGRVALLSSFLDVQYVIEEGIKRVRMLAADLATKLRAPDGDAGTVMSELTIYVVSSLAGG